MNPFQAQLMSLIVFAGAAQLAALSLISGGAGSFLSIWSTTAVISSRHLLYSAAFRQHVHSLSFPWRAALAFFLTDEMFAVTATYKEKTGYFHAIYALISGITFYITWNVSTFIGILVGTEFGNIEKIGLEFAIAATFIAITIPTIKSSPTLIAIIISGSSALIFGYIKIHQSQSLIAASLTGMMAGYLVSTKLEKEK